MVNVALLRKTIRDKGMTVSSVACKSGILRNTLYVKMGKPSSFNVDDIDSITEAMKLSKSERDSIFFAKDVN